MKKALFLFIFMMVPIQIVNAGLVEKTFAPFAKMLDKYLMEHITEQGGLVSGFDYNSALNDKEVIELRQKQNEKLLNFNINKMITRESANAFWINAYNFLMIDYLLTNPRRGRIVDSVRDYGHLLNPYRVFRQYHFNIGGEMYSLDRIEKDILLGDKFEKRGWKEARVHFAVNCASVGCPPLRKQIYTEKNLDTLLTENTRKALKTPLHLYREGETLYLSSLFRWYKKDYKKEEGSVKSFILKYADSRVIQKVQQAKRVRYINYDWSINDLESIFQGVRH